MSRKITFSSALSEAKALPADGLAYCLPCGLEAVHFPSTRMAIESVVVHNDEGGCRSRHLPNKPGWTRPDWVAWASVTHDSRYGGYGQGQR